MQEPIKCDSICGHDDVEKACKSGTCMCGKYMDVVSCIVCLSLYLHSAPFRFLMMQHNSYVSSSSIITIMPHDCMAFSYFIRYQLDDGAAFGGLPSVMHIDQTHSSNTPVR